MLAELAFSDGFRVVSAVLPQSLQLFVSTPPPANASGWARSGRVRAAVAQARRWVESPEQSARSSCKVEGLDDRLSELRHIALEEDAAFSCESEGDLKRFLAISGAAVRPAIFLQEDGILRGKWKNLQGEQIALSFLGSGSVQIVYFVQRSNGMMARIVGQDTLEGALAQARSLGLRALLNA